MGRCAGSRNGNARLTEEDVVLIRKCAEERAALAAKISDCENVSLMRARIGSGSAIDSLPRSLA